ncbi:glycosyltransferase [Niveispirillum sp. KHB5.9]|uniref:glycosyltransferase n=1 Tax=Niveispirillum sp. KHB5.9 TaxID=3400269 RepID=UPI003A86B1B1
MTRRITAVLACHDRREKTLACLETLAACLPAARARDIAGIGVILVDDGSRDGTAAAVARAFPDVRVLTGDGTLWWGGAMALGLSAIDGDSDFHLWLNDDVVLDADALARLVAAHDDLRARTGKGAVVVGGTREPGDGTASYGGGVRGGLHPFRFIPVTPTDRPVPCEAMNGNIVLVPRDAARRLGGMDPAFIGVQGMGDTDYALRARRADIPVMLAPGTLGTCARGRRVLPWRDGRRLLADRLRELWGPRGYPPRAWSLFARRHGGLLWPLWFALPYLRGIVAALRPAPGPRPRRIALLEGIVPAYRLPVLRGLARSADPLFTAFHGAGMPGYTATAVNDPLPVAEVRTRNLFWPGGRGRIACTAGTLPALLSGPDAIVAGFHAHDAGIWAVWLLRRLTGRPRFILTGHFVLTPAGDGLRGLMRRALARGADALLPYGEQGAAACRAIGIDPARLFITGNSVDIDHIRAMRAGLSATAVRAARQEQGLGDDPVFLFIGRLYPSKRVDMVIDAVRDLRRAGRPCRLLIVGDGVDMARLKAAAGDDPGIRFTGAIFDEAALLPLFALATAVVVPGSIGLITAHAFAHDVPVVSCRDTDGHGPEFAYLADGINALLAEAGVAGSLTAALDRLLTDADLRTRLRAGARRTADGLGIDRPVRATLDAIRAALGDAIPPPD